MNVVEIFFFFHVSASALLVSSVVLNVVGINYLIGIVHQSKERSIGVSVTTQRRTKGDLSVSVPVADHANRRVK